MKRGVVISLALAALLMVGCESKPKEQAAAAVQQEQSAPQAAEQAQAAANSAEQRAEAAKESAAEATAAAKESVTEAAEAAKEAVSESAEAAKEAASEAVQSATESASEAAEAAKEAVSEATESAKEEAAAAATTATAAAAAATSEAESAAANIDAAKLYATKCASCHGPKGERKALGKSAPIGGMAKGEVLEKLKGYKAGTLNLYGMGALMKTQVASLSDAELEALAAYISTLK